MNFTVVWTVEARDELTEIWLSHWDRAGVTAATHRIDTLLGRNEDQGNRGQTTGGSYSPRRSWSFTGSSKPTDM
jgi:plasmid stabilization system protein ParE